MGKIEAVFCKGIIGTDPIVTDGRPQYAFMGRSNAGKSTLLNTLLGKEGLARASKTPGKTQQINFFLVNRSLYVVDLPGYGYARLSRKRREKLHKLIFWYLFRSHAPLKKVVFITDIRRDLTVEDKEFLHLLREAGYPLLLVANKEDTLTQKERHERLKKLQEEVQGVPIVSFSARTGKGKEKLWKEIFAEEEQSSYREEK